MPSVPRFATTPPNALVYIRVSTPGQEEEGTSLETQRARCLSLAAERGYHVVEVYSDVYSGAYIRDRPRLNALRAAVRAGGVQVVLAYALDRLSRNQAHIYILADEFESRGCQLEFVTENFEDSAVGRFIRSAKAFAAEVEREKITERTQRGRRARLEAGKLVAGWHPPYGYQWTPDKTGLVIDPVTAPVVQRIFTAAARGESLRAIAVALSGDQIPRPTSRAPYWSHSMVRWMLINPLYCGRPVGLRTKMERNPRTGRRRAMLRDPAEHIPLPPGVAPALVPEAVFQAVQEQLTRNKTRAFRNNANPEGALLRAGFARCGHCGWGLVVRNDRPNAGQRAHGTSPSYFCFHDASRGSVCAERPSIAIHILDEAVTAKVVAILQDGDLLREGLARLEAEEPARRDLTAFDRQLGELARQQRTLVGNLALVSGTAAVAVAEKLSELAATEQRLRAERATAAEQRASWSQAHAQLAHVIEWCTQLAGRFDSLPYAEKRRVLTALGITAHVWQTSHTPRWEVRARISLPDTPIVDSIDWHTVHNGERVLALRWASDEVDLVGGVAISRGIGSRAVIL